MPSAVAGPVRPPIPATGIRLRDPQRGGAIVRALASLLVLLLLAAGLPAALVALGGSPVPRRLPSWHQVLASLARPDNGTLFLGAVRWISWLAWAVFIVCALAETVARLRGRPAWRLPAVGPFQALGSSLVGSICLGLLPGTAMAVPGPVPRPGVTVTAQVRAATAARTLTDPGHVLQVGAAPATAKSSASPGRHQLYVVVKGDSLWEIATRLLGDGERWQEIFAINRGRSQPDGGRLTDPDLIYPGWILALPSPPSPAAHPRHQPPVRAPLGRHAGARPGEGSGRKAGRPVAPGRPPTPHLGHHPVGNRQRQVSIGLPDGGLVGITLAAAISAALVAWRLHKRRIAVPGWPASARGPRRPDIPAAIRVLRRAHLRSLAADTADAHGELFPDAAGSAPWGDTEEDDGLDEFGAPTATGARQATTEPQDQQAGAGQPATSTVQSAVSISASASAGGSVGRAVGRPAAGPAGLRSAPARLLPSGTVVFGIRGGEEIPLADVARPVLGLTGPGAYGAARALLISALAARPAGRVARVVIPAADARLLTRSRRPAARIQDVTPGWPDGLTVTASLADALDLVTAGTARRGRRPGLGSDLAASARPPDSGVAETVQVVLIATADPQSFPRVRAVLEAGASAGTTGILLGELPPGASCQVGADGEILAASEPWLIGARAAHMSAADAVAMLSLLRGADGHLSPEPPARHPDPADHASSTSGANPPGQSRPSAGHSPGGDLAADVADQEHAGRPPAGHDVAGPAAAPVRPANAPLAWPGDEPRAEATGEVGAPATTPPVAISVLGPLRITVRGSELTGGLRKARELLAYLAVHPDGATGERISAELWPDLSPRYAASQRKLALRKAREMLRTAAGLPAAMFVVLAGDRYRLDPGLISVDLWQFDAALDHASAAGSEEDQLTTLRHAATLYRGPLADGAGYDWAEYYAEPARRRAVDALARTAAILQPRDPEQALGVLETAITHDPYNEAVYQAVMRIQARLGRPDAARRTLALLETRLAVLGLTPDPATREAAGAPGIEETGARPGAHSAKRARTGSSDRSARSASPQPPPGRHRR